MFINTSLRNHQFVFETKAGLFSKDAIDPGSQLLIEHVEVVDGSSVLDIGCGYGAIGLPLAKCIPSGSVCLVDTDIRAIKYCQKNSYLNRISNVKIIASDGLKNLHPENKFDLIVSNPPTHAPKEVILEFITDSRRRLKSGGRIYFVTETRIAPMIKRAFTNAFGNYTAVASNFRYTLSLSLMS